MARRMKNPNPKRVVGLQYGNLCPHCGKQVDFVRYILPAPSTPIGYFVHHLWNSAICENTFGFNTFDKETDDSTK